MKTVSDLPFILLGAGGHAKVLVALARLLGLQIRGVCAPELASQGILEWQGLPVIGDDQALDVISPSDVVLINGIGQTVGSLTRQIIYEKMRNNGFVFPSLVHPRAWVAQEAVLADGVQVMAGAVIQPDCRIGENTTINSSASIDHDSHIGAHVHIAPGAILCGGVRVMDGAFIASGAVVAPGIEVGEKAVVGAGVALVRNLQAGQVVLGAKVRFG